MGEDNVHQFDPEYRRPYHDPVTRPFSTEQATAELLRIVVKTVCRAWLLASAGALILLGVYPQNGGVQVVAAINAVGVPLQLVIRLTYRLMTDLSGPRRRKPQT